jgi:hypothetical protein
MGCVPYSKAFTRANCIAYTQPNANAAELFRFEADRAKWEADKLLLEVTRDARCILTARLGRAHCSTACRTAAQHSMSLPIRYGLFVDS